MGVRAAFDEFIDIAASARSPADLGDLMDHFTRRMGYDFFALTHHVDMAAASPGAIRLHNYPLHWEEFFDRNRLGLSDPIHRASQRTVIGFAWHRVPELIDLTPVDRHVLVLAEEHGIGDGFTIPAHIPGEAHGSCSFAMATGKPAPTRSVALAQLAGTYAFEAARSLWRVRPRMPGPVLTDRQRDCLILVARGKTDKEVARLVGISPETVIQHIKQARDRYGVQKRTSLLIRALFDGTICFADILKR